MAKRMGVHKIKMVMTEDHLLRLVTSDIGIRWAFIKAIKIGLSKFVLELFLNKRKVIKKDRKFFEKAREAALKHKCLDFFRIAYKNIYKCSII